MRLSNMNAIVSVRCTGFDVSASIAVSEVGASGPCPVMQLCNEAPPGTKPALFASYTPVINPMYSLATLRWNQGGLKVCSIASQRGGKTIKSTFPMPGVSLGECSTEKIEGSGWS